MPRRRTTYASLDRIQYIDAVIRRGGCVNCTTVRKRFEVSRDVVLDDVEYMLSRLGRPIIFEPRLNSYIYTERVGSLPTIAMTEGEALTLLTLRNAVEPYRGSPFQRPIETAFRKLAAQLSDIISFPTSHAVNAVSFRHLGTAKIDPAVFMLLYRARQRMREVEFDYRKPGEKTIVHHRMQPWHFSFRGALCYLVGYDYNRDKPITFALPRILRPEVTAKKFELPVSFSAAEFFAKAFSVLGGEGDHRVILRFKGASADRVRECEWHETEIQRDLPDGRLELELRLGALDEVARWVLSWGGEACVVGPKQLRDLVATAAAEVVKQYR